MPWPPPQRRPVMRAAYPRRRRSGGSRAAVRAVAAASRRDELITDRSQAPRPRRLAGGPRTVTTWLAARGGVAAHKTAIAGTAGSPCKCDGAAEAWPARPAASDAVRTRVADDASGGKPRRPRAASQGGSSHQPPLGEFPHFRRAVPPVRPRSWPDLRAGRGDLVGRPSIGAASGMYTAHAPPVRRPPPCWLIAQPSAPRVDWGCGGSGQAVAYPARPRGPALGRVGHRGRRTRHRLDGVSQRPRVGDIAGHRSAVPRTRLAPPRPHPLALPFALFSGTWSCLRCQSDTKPPLLHKKHFL